MIKTRTITTTERYEVCDLCGEEITANYGNTIVVEGDEAKGTERIEYLVHMEAQGCGQQVILEAISKKSKKK